MGEPTSRARKFSCRTCRNEVLLQTSHCATRQCECLKNKMVCTDMCKCEGCENQIDENRELNEDHEEESEDSDFE